MSRYNSEHPSLNPGTAVFIGIVVSIGLILLMRSVAQRGQTALSGKMQTPTAQHAPTAAKPSPTVQADSRTATPTPTRSPSTATPTPIVTATPSNTPTPTVTPTPSLTPTPTRDLARCNVSGCGTEAQPLPTVEYDTRLLLRHDPPERRACPECPQNEILSNDELDALLGSTPATMAQLRTIALSQQPYPIAPGIVYIVSDYVHHVVVDLKESGFKLRNIIPPVSSPETRETVRITPSYCLGPKSLVVMTADYHGLVGSNKTEDGRAIFFHLGRAALFQLDGEYDIDVIREDETFQQTAISWGGGPIFMWDGEYNYNPEQEWFTPENLDHYENTKWAKMVAAISDDRRYLFLSASFDITLKEHAENVINLGQNWGINVDRAMRFDGSESAYLAIRLGDYMVPVLGLEEPLIVNCFAIERSRAAP